MAAVSSMKTINYGESKQARNYSSFRDKHQPRSDLASKPDAGSYGCLTDNQFRATQANFDQINRDLIARNRKMLEQYKQDKEELNDLMSCRRNPSANKQKTSPRQL